MTIDVGNTISDDVDRAPAIIAGAFQTGVLGVRTLIRHGVNAACFDSDTNNPGFKSTYGRARLSPDPDTSPQQWLKFMLGWAAEFKKAPVLIASSDKFVTAIAKHEHELRPHFVFSPGIPLHAALSDKLPQYELAAKHGMPMPRTQVVNNVVEVTQFAAQAAFPALIKPNHFREWQKFPEGHALLDAKVCVVDTADELVRRYKEICYLTPQVILQEVILGDDSAKRVYLSCYDGGGRRIGHAMFRELRCDPLGFGPASITEPVADPEVDAICDRFLRDIGYSGICEIEMKRDSRDGIPKLIEANPRLSGGGDAAPYDGVDLCWIHYQDLIGQRFEPVKPLGRDFRHIVLRADARALPAYWCAGLVGIKDILSSYRAPRAFFDLDWNDWRYSVETLYLSLRSFVWRMFRESIKRWRSS